MKTRIILGIVFVVVILGIGLLHFVLTGFPIQEPTQTGITTTLVGHYPDYVKITKYTPGLPTTEEIIPNK